MKHPTNFIDLTGKRFERLTVLEYAGKEKWKCKCDCGNEIITSGSGLRYGHTKSCGCYRKDYPKLTYKTHGETQSKLYGIWNGIKSRCYNPKRESYKNYGARGITM